MFGMKYLFWKIPKSKSLHRIKKTRGVSKNGINKIEFFNGGSIENIKGLFSDFTKISDLKRTKVRSEIGK